jgi:hypothetical protein
VFGVVEYGEKTKKQWLKRKMLKVGVHDYEKKMMKNMKIGR